MLDRLPNEILHNIFRKTNVDTAHECRFLNSRFDTLITKYGFHKEHLQEFSIHPSNWCLYATSSMAMDIEINRKKTVTFSDYKELLNELPQYFDRVGTVDALLLNRISINTKLLNILSQLKFLSQIRKFSVCDCKVKPRNEEKWFDFLKKLHLEELLVNTTMETVFLTFPPTILNHVEKVFEHHSSVNYTIMEMPWLVDSVLLDWFTPEKTLYLPRALTGLTIEGILQCIQIRDGNNKNVVQFGCANRRHVFN